MSNKEKILFITRAIPYPVRGGDFIVLKNFVKTLSKLGFKCDLLFLQRKNNEKLLAENVKQEFGFYNVYFERINSKINPKYLFDWIFRKKSFIFNRFYSKKFSKKLLELAKSGEYNYIVCEHSFMFTNILFNTQLQIELTKRNIKTFINVHVIETTVLKDYLEQIEKLIFWAKKLILKKELKYLQDIEFKCIKKADASIFLAKEEMDRVKILMPECSDKFFLSPVIPFIEEYPYSSPEDEQENTLFFLGTLSWIQNKDALEYFIKDIFPLILQKKPETKFFIVGRGADKKIKSFHNGKTIFFRGEVENIFQEINKYTLMVAPVRIQGGTRIKILEALAWGKALICTDTALEGINIHNRNILETANTPEIFTEKVIYLLSNKKMRNELKQNSRTLFERLSKINFRKSSLRKIFLKNF
jgi:glycosyltransferase involved in cell wall biosynthesis